MVGGGIRRDDAAPGISSKNVFAALETLKKKKKSSVKDRKVPSKSKGLLNTQEKEPEPSQVFWIPTPLNKSWADVDDDDDDYYKTAPVLPGWGVAGQQQEKDVGVPAEEESESEDDGLDDGDDDIEDEGEQVPEAPPSAELIVNTHSLAPVAPKDSEKQLSKKEQKKKELEELDALLAEFAVSSKDDRGACQTESNVATREKNPDEQRKDGDNENIIATEESKTSKKKKGKKEKSSREVKDTPELADDADGSDGVIIAEAVEETAAGVDMKERLKKVASMKRKKSGKEMDIASKIASTEAAARSAKLAAAKKKEKNHYNQQPVR
ncbi:GPALPP motifs-containing protein 1 [Dendrobium catenatum]|uniref:Uncharacterized protein n=1 Tax=Dendrobium catenatum TaxID=906689 RepID=A0A2I0X618_9ASPA|nr:GPALPP motifs-containing protein 1 [Dendrobium catenatum]PKU83343.1 hypothetical protein MA16_Dca016290 [Dendrobium catenatum]